MIEHEPIELPEDVTVIVPLKDTVVFPHALMPIDVYRATSAAGLQEAMRTERPVGFVLQRDPGVEEPNIGDIYSVGSLCRVMRYMTTPDGAHHAIVAAESRIRIVELVPGYPFMVARTETIQESTEWSNEVQARALFLKQRAFETVELGNQYGRANEFIVALAEIKDPNQVADTIAAFMDIKPEEKQGILEAIDTITRLNLVIEHLSQRLDVLRLTKELDDQTRSKLDDQTRERLLREQLDTIRSELGDKATHENDIDELREALNHAGLPEAAMQEADRELRRLERMGDQASESSMIRSWLECVSELPWSNRTQTVIDLDRARSVLEEDHHGLTKVKKRILEFLAVRSLKRSSKGPILCFIGPPGVGKTSLGKSIARAVNVEFARLSLGGVHDEAEIRGHRRTYIGAMPGNIIRTLRKIGVCNPLIMLDEIDKLGAGVHGDPSSALLEVLDPEQNDTFTDNYVGLPFDLSGVFFIATANSLDQIPRALHDRMEVIDLPGYATEEKIVIAQRHLVPKQLNENGLDAQKLTITEAALEAVIVGYTREAGVRGLERKIGAIVRHAAITLAGEKSTGKTIHDTDVVEILGPPQFESEIAMRAGVPGVATGLAWTPVGGDILFIEATHAEGKGGLLLTGQIGDVMRESAQAALSLLKSRAKALGIATKFDEIDIHIHIPAGATPKDGPSAGVAIFVALASLLMDRPVPHDAAMTGEISLRGLILPVGGIKEKCLAAHRAGIRTVYLPARNKKDLDEIPSSARDQLEFIWLDTIDELIAHVLPISAVVGEFGG